MEGEYGTLHYVPYDSRFAFAQPIVSEWQTRGRCDCTFGSAQQRKMLSRDRVGFLEAPLPTLHQSLSQAIAESHKYDQEADCLYCNEKIFLSNETIIEEATEIVHVSVNRTMTLPNGVRRKVSRHILDETIYLIVNGVKVYYDLIGGLLHIGGTGNFQ